MDKIPREEMEKFIKNMQRMRKLKKSMKDFLDRLPNESFDESSESLDITKQPEVTSQPSASSPPERSNPGRSVKFERNDSSDSVSFENVYSQMSPRINWRSRTMQQLFRPSQSMQTSGPSGPSGSLQMGGPSQSAYRNQNLRKFERNDSWNSSASSENIYSPMAESPDNNTRNHLVPISVASRRPFRNIKNSPFATIPVNNTPIRGPSRSVRRNRNRRNRQNDLSMEDVKEGIINGANILDWKKGTFAWIKFTERSKNLPGFVLPTYNGKQFAQSITLKGTLSIGRFVFFKSNDVIKDTLKPARYTKAVQKFNADNDCSYV